ncbi:hypothetical protein A9Q87_05155 [Flavobacteriales bacterium 34_180_T64]|nr:hypothetical protein A9Q87_05155 [Flavobacteriales bacterium 34_180_T64]
MNAEYFFDIDLGVGTGDPLIGFVSGSTIDQNFSISTTGLSPGIHKLYIRVQDADGDWSIYDKNVFYINPTQSNTAEIAEAEYFFDTDLGVGTGDPLMGFMQGSTIDQDFNISTTGLSPGIHKLYVRVINEDGTWSIYDKNVVYINPNQSNTAEIAGAEYFFDTDLGVGTGDPLMGFMQGSTIDQDFNISTTGLSPGIHKLYVRVINEDGTWSLYDKNVVYINPNQSNTAEIAGAEYFFDTDLGVGTGDPLMGFIQGSTIDQDFNISTTGLSPGIHKLYVRLINEDGTWSLYDKNVLYINPNQTNTAEITAAEYFIDTDLGVGTGDPLTGFISGSMVDQDFNIPTTGMPEADYKLYVRVLNADGTWSLYDGKDFTIGPPDSDGDGILDDDDNCPTTANAGQEDIDMDTVGDVCDNCPDDDNTDQADDDGDNVGDICDVCPGFDDAIDVDNDNFADGCDCDDSNASINPNATEILDNDIDEDCDGFDLKTWYEDSDSDTFGNLAVSQTANTAPTGYVLDNTDCDDTNADIYPGAPEIVDNDVDEDCDGFDLKTWFEDADGDTYGNASVSQEANIEPSGYVADNTDCDDTNANINPGATEITDNDIDEDCDGFDLKTWHEDADSDTFGNLNVSQEANSEPTGYVADNTDCDDTNADIYPGAPEIVDNDIDEDCDGFDLKTWYEDADGDTFGNASVSQEANLEPLGYVADNTDCDDTNANINPGALEIPDNGIDEDCDGLDLLTWYADADGDTFGNVNVTQEANSQPSGFVSDDTDCDDTNANVYPGATEIPDNDIDDDCDGFDLKTWYEDADGDTYGNPDASQESNTQPVGYVLDNTDCDDTNVGINPGATEIPENGIDEDCDGSDNAVWYEDADGDGFGNPNVSQTSNDQPSGYVSDNTDCDDTNANINPGEIETPDNGIDDDCDGFDAITWYEDADGDGFGNPDVSLISNTQPTGYITENTDCDDTNANINPGATEIPDNGIDEDCDGSDNAVWYEDADGDGFGNPNVSQTSNDQPAGYVSDNTDCDDTDANVYPGAPEVTDNDIDEDCDGFDLKTWYEDADADTYGNPNMSQQSNTQPTGYILDNTDCDDTDAAINPGATEIADNDIDEDCDGFDLKTWYEDADGDGFGNPAISQQANTQPTGYVADNTDCDDTNVNAYPGATETPDNDIDEDCDGFDLKTWYEDADNDTYGNPNVSLQANTQPIGYILDNTDCDDTDANINPEASEIVDNDIDENCDGFDLKTWYEDADGDGFGNPDISQQANTQPSDYVADNTDCDDTEASVFPGNPEVCDGLDNNCDGTVDEGVESTFYEDADGDGFGNPDMSILACAAPEGYVDDDTDCDDTEANNYPGNTEVCDGIDNDCDGLIDDEDDSLDDATTWYEDADGDGYGNDLESVYTCESPEGYILDNTDCNDTDANAYPGAEEIPNDGIDQDCDGSDLSIGDTDDDGVLDDIDNCIDTPNPDQLDSDNDGIGDVCDEIVVPRGFSPNGDNKNDTWVIENISRFPNNKVMVFNRWGNKVFEAHNYQNNWDGKSTEGGGSNRLPVGPYLYIIELNEAGTSPVQGWMYINY